VARKNVKSFAMLEDADLSGNLTGTMTNVQNLDKASIHISWAGSSPVGVVTVEARNSERDSWYTVDMGAPINISGNSGDHLLVFNELPFYDMRLQYVATSGTGTVDAIITMKQSGG
jgi:hypothetical protein